MTQYPRHEKSLLDIIDPTGEMRNAAKTGACGFGVYVMDDLGPDALYAFQPAYPENGLPARMTDLRTGVQVTA